MNDYPRETRPGYTGATSYDQHFSSGQLHGGGNGQEPSHNPPPPYGTSSSLNSTSSNGALQDGRGAGRTSFRTKMKNIAPGADPADILNPPPPSFGRIPPGDVSYESFTPCVLASVGKELDKGFPSAAPPSNAQPHPFVAHDVREEDWLRFMSDLKRAGSLSPMNRVAAGAVPLALGLGLAGVLVAYGIEKVIKKKKVGPVSEIIEQWNYHFFHRRLMEVTMIQGEYTSETTGTTSVSPSNAGKKEDYSAMVYQGKDVESSADGQEEDGQGSSVFHQREKTPPRERGEQKQEKQSRQKQRWSLVVSYRPLNNGSL